MELKPHFRKYSLLYLALRRINGAVLSGPTRRSPFFRRYAAKVNVNMVDRRGAVCRSPNFIYFRIPKAANSTVTLSLQSLINAGRIDGDNPPAKAKKLFSPLSSLSSEEVEHLKDKFFTFTFVRNPFTRIASAYLSKVVGSERQKIHVTRWGSRSTNDPVTFAEFCEYLRQAKGYLDDGHWARQCDLITLPLDQLDFIGKIENLDQDLRYVIRRLFGLEKDFEIQSWQKGRTGASSIVKQLYGEKEMAIVREIYAEDFRVFGYDPDLLL
jgi:hypothetical protein